MYDTSKAIMALKWYWMQVRVMEWRGDICGINIWFVPEQDLIIYKMLFGLVMEVTIGKGVIKYVSQIFLWFR